MTNQNEHKIMHGIQSSALKYVLITPARDEADFMEENLKSVIAQTVLPLKCNTAHLSILMRY